MSKYYKKEDVINAIENKIAEYIPTLYGRYEEIPLELRMAIENLPTIEVSEDCISREWLEKNAEEFGGYYENTVYAFPLSKLDDAPSVVPTGRKTRQVERAEGEWVRTFDGNEWYWYCSNCKEQWYEDDLYMGGNEFPHFCPNCGAKMKGAEE